METMAEYLAELVKAGLEDRKAASLPEGVSVREIVKISEENHMDYLLLGALLKTDGLSEEEKGLLREKSTGKHAFYRYAAAGIEEAGGTDGTGKDSLSTHERSPDEILLSVSVSAGNE